MPAPLAPPALNLSAHFSFDFCTRWGNVGLGRTQAAFPSDKGAAPSTPSLKKWTTPCRATQICLSLPVVTRRLCGGVLLGRRLQTLPFGARDARAQRTHTGAGRVWLIKADPALFHTPLRARAVCDTPQPITGAGFALRQKGHSC
jgi:hypothetical protein